MSLKFGRKKSVYTARSMRSALALSAALDPLGPAPNECRDYLSTMKGKGPNMYENDQLGDCVCVDTANTLILRTANAAQTTVVPTVADVVKLYEVFGYRPGDDSTDNGVSELDMCNYLVRTGFLGHKADSTGNIEPSNLNHLKWSTLLFGHTRLGINVPGYALDQFKAGRPWDVDNNADQTIDGGHDIPLVDFRGGMFYVFTWGKTQPMTPDAVLAWTEEAHAELHYDWIMEQGEAPSGFDLATLAEKLSFVTVAEAAQLSAVA